MWKCKARPNHRKAALCAVYMSGFVLGDCHCSECISFTLDSSCRPDLAPFWFARGRSGGRRWREDRGRNRRALAVVTRAEGRATLSRAGTALRSACILQPLRSCAQLWSCSDQLGDAWWWGCSAKKGQFPQTRSYVIARLSSTRCRTAVASCIR